MERIRRLLGMKPDPSRSRLLSDDDRGEKQRLVQNKYKVLRGFCFSRKRCEPTFLIGL